MEPREMGRNPYTDPQPGDRWIDLDHGRVAFTHIASVDDPEFCGKFGKWAGVVRFEMANGGGMTQQGLDATLAKSTVSLCPLGSHVDDFTCMECGVIFNVGYWGGGEKYRRAGLCLHDKHWHDAIAAVKRGAAYVVNGGVYNPAPDVRPEDRSMAGFGGQLFRIQCADRSVIESRNVWFSGDVPPKFRERLPDNATFLPTVAA